MLCSGPDRGSLGNCLNASTHLNFKNALVGSPCFLSHLPVAMLANGFRDLGWDTFPTFSVFFLEYSESMINKQHPGICAYMHSLPCA